MRVIHKDKIDKVAPIVRKMAETSSQWSGIVGASGTVNSRMLLAFCEWARQKAGEIEEIINSEDSDD